MDAIKFISFNQIKIVILLVNEFSSKFENLAVNAPKALKMYSKCSKYHFETVSVRNRG